VAVEVGAGPLWRTQVSQLSECPAWAPEPSHPNPFSSLVRLRRAPPATSTVQRTDPASDGRTLETCLVTLPPSGGGERHSVPAVTC
jgi:hypothetical protein